MSGLQVGFKLQQLELDFLEIVLADPAGPVLILGDVHCILKALQILLRQIHHRIGELGVNEVRGDLKRESTLVIDHLRARDRSRILGGLKAASPFSAALNRITYARVDFR